MKLRNLKLVIIIIFILSNVNLISAANKNITSLAPTCSKVSSVTSKKYPNLKNLTIKNCHLKSIPNNVLKLTELRKLDLSNNNITKVSNDLNNFKKLENLTLRNNQIKSINGISKIINLKKLDLSGNYLSNITVLDKYSNLEKLDLSYNAINSISSFKELNKLKTVNLSYNQLIKLPEMPDKLTSINLEKNYLNLDEGCCLQYKKYVNNQNRIILKPNLSELQISKALNNPKYVKELVISSDGSSVVEFSDYILLIKADDNLYDTKDFLENYDSLNASNYSIVVDIVADNRDKYRLTGNQVFNISKTAPLLTIPISMQDEKVENKKEKTKKTVDDPSFTRELKKHDYFNNYLFKTLSIVVCAIFVVPVIAIIIIFIYLNKLNRDVNSTIVKKN